MNNQSDFVKEICKEQNILCESLSRDYIMRLTKDGFTRHIFGAYWDINTAAADRIACDKTACYLLLKKSGISAVLHELMYNPRLRIEYVHKEGEWLRAAEFFGRHNRKIVIKPNRGTKGQDVYFCQTIPELEAAAYSIFMNHPDAALSPYHEIEKEYRVFYIDGSCRFVYGKSKGATWQHNLSQGASAFEVSCAKRISELKETALRAAKCIGITFATVDIAELPSGELAVMEINSGVQAKQLLEQLPHLRPVVKSIYEEATGLFFKSDRA
jgi:glutathione synthase/RimK-type ligase-like ATP-grasp enzyme